MTDQVVVLFLIIAAGTALGRLTWRGISLGTSGVIFAALVAGHFGYEVPEVAGILGLVTFLYCLGISAGPSFFRVFRHQGSSLALVGAAMIVSAAGTAWIFARLARLPAD
ncbi:MAG: transporter, partial [Planctomycetes bacterium]|nr:transporter [Planctomycetota bacterium]